MGTRTITIDGNEAAAKVAFALSEVVAIYPITPSSAMGELADAWAADGEANLWGSVPRVVEMQSEGGAAGAVHGALQCGALTTTFTASQGLLLMIPNMYKIAGELTPAVFHVAARSLAAQALSIFGDHSDVMAVRQTGFAMLASGSVQEVMDLAAVAHLASMESRLPFLHFFDGFRTSHEVAKIAELGRDDLAALVDPDRIREIRGRALDPEHPTIRGTAQNPDVFFQARETVNPWYERTPGIVAAVMERLGARTGRRYRLFDYVGAPDAERVLVMMGSGAEAAHETVEALVARGEKVGLVKVRLYRPFSASHFLAALPASVRTVVVLDRTKEPGAAGEPLYQDVRTVLAEAADSGERRAAPRVLGGRYGLSSKEVTPGMLAAALAEAGRDRPRNHFTLGIVDDVSGTSLEFDAGFSVEAADTKRCLFYGLGSDGTVGANKNSIKIIGEETEHSAQGYFVYDSKKAGATTVSHLRFGSRPIRSSYLISRAGFVACHQPQFLERQDLLESLEPGGIFLLNTPEDPGVVWERLPRVYQERLIGLGAAFWVIDADRVAREAGMAGRINTVMQTCFFAISGVLPRDEAIARIKAAIEKSYGSKGRSIVEKNFAAVDRTLGNLHRVEVPGRATSAIELIPPVPAGAPDFVTRVTGELLAGRGDQLPVSALPVDGVWPVGTQRYQKLNLADEIPVWDEKLCIQCGKCALVCPHAAVRTKVYREDLTPGAPPSYKWAKTRGSDFADGHVMTIQVAPEDCTGCGICVEVCPAKDKSNVKHKALDMAPQRPLRDAERENLEFFLALPEYDRRLLKLDTVKGAQILEPLFEYSGACSGCGETPYVKLLSQLFGDRALVANATGCSSIYGGNLPTTPWSANKDGRGPGWANSLFEDNAEFGLGYRLAVDQHRARALSLLEGLSDRVGGELAAAIREADEGDEAGVHEQRERVKQLLLRLSALGDDPAARELASLSKWLLRKSIWIVGGDGWAYDIGFGGLDHVLASGEDVNVLVLDTEVYSNTGGQASKATPLGAVAKFAAGGKPTGKKDLALMAMSYGNVYVARVAMGAKDTQTIKAFLEAEAWHGPSLIIAYSHCIAHGIPMRHGLDHQKAAVDSGHWPLYRYHPAKPSPLTLDSRAPKLPVAKYMEMEARYRMLDVSHPEAARRFREEAQRAAEERYQHLVKLVGSGSPEGKEVTEV